MTDLAVLVVLAAAKLLFHVLTDGQYGFHRDELQTFADARHLAWGYVAYPPLTPFLARIELILFGTSLRGFRFLAALAQSIVFVITGLMTKRMGGGRAAQIIAATAVAIAPISLAASALMQYVSFDFLWFVLMAYFIVRLIDSNDPRWWIPIGIVIGLGVMTKYTVVFYVAALAIGFFATPLRAQIRSKWLWIGAIVAIAIAAPNMIWQLEHHFISLDFLHFIHERDIRWGRTKNFIPDQFFIATNPFTVPLWLLGFYAVFRERRYRILGWIAAAMLVIFVVARGRGYYAGPIYPMLMAAGAAGLERRIAMRRSLYVSIAATLAISGIIAGAIVLPIAPVHSRIWNLAIKVNEDFVEELGWPELVAEVARIYNTLPPDERAHTGIFGNNYGEAGAVEAFGPAYGLPRPLSGTNSFWLRGYPTPPPDILIVLGDSREGINGACSVVTLAGTTPNPWNVRNEETTRHQEIYLCRKLRVPIDKFWPKLLRFG